MRSIRQPYRLAAALAPLGLLLLTAGCGKSDAGKPDAGRAAGPAVAVTVAPARLGSVQRSVEVVGSLWGEEDVTVSNKVPGKIIAIHKDVGDRVGPGEPLVQLLRNDYLLDANQKQQALSESLAKLGLTDLPPADFGVTGVPSVRRAKLQADNAQAKFNRGQQLFQQRQPLISQQDYEDLQTALSVAQTTFESEVAAAKGIVGEARTRRADLQIALQALSDATVRAPSETYPTPNVDPPATPGEAKAATTRPSTAPANTQLPDRIALASADDDLPKSRDRQGVEEPAGDARGSFEPTRTRVQPALEGPSSRPATAPTSAPSTLPGGVGMTVRSYRVVARYGSVGELARAITPLFRLVDDDPLKLRAAVPERFFRDLVIGQKVTLRIEAYPQEFHGEVTRINPQVDPANRTFQIEVLVPNADGRLPAGAFARAAVQTHVQDGVVLVPREAVVSFAGVDKVFAIEGGNKSREVQVELGETRGNEIEVVKGLKGGEQVAVSGTGRLANGVAVEVKK